MHGFRHLFTNISLTAGKDTLTTDLALGHISRAALQRAGFSSLHHYLPPPRAARTRRMVQPPPPPSIRSRRQNPAKQKTA
ncbi:hypothetical protein [Neisseria meningitidis]|uniref:hypothetical protein n=1 Tax=Neisseria meningitidis TaxID=487 RepID=UPI001EFC7782|nr:hypothetical protein [Neisseria meningitidis]